MKILGQALAQNSKMIPTGGAVGKLLALLPLFGLLAMLDWGYPGIEKIFVSIGMFSFGVLLSRDLPVWREGSASDLAARKLLIAPLATWIALGKRIGGIAAIGCFFLLCLVIYLLASWTRMSGS
jgi:hypothetical protein